MVKRDRGWVILWFVVGLFLGGGLVGWAYGNVNGIVMTGIAVATMVITLVLDALDKRGRL